jgi:ankyrin repeat protein
MNTHKHLFKNQKDIELALIAAGRGDCSYLKKLAAAQVDFNIIHLGTTPLFMAVQNGHADAVDTLLDSGARIDLEVNGISPLFFAVLKGHEEVVRRLLLRDIESETSCRVSMKTLKNCYSNFNVDIMSRMERFYIRAGVNLQDEINLTPLQIAQVVGNEGILDLLDDNKSQYNPCFHQAAKRLRADDDIGSQPQKNAKVN